MKKIQKIIDLDLCLGCGLCEAIAGKNKCEMKLQKSGFYLPVFKQEPEKQVIEQILSSCPSVHIQGENVRGVWGNIKQIHESWSTDDNIRRRGSSGGVITAMLLFLIESKEVDAVLHVGLEEGSYIYNQLKTSGTRHEIIDNAASRYAPALIFDKIKETLDRNSNVYAFVGKPCDIAGLKNFISVFPQYKDRIRYFIALFCAGMPSYNGTRKILAMAGKNEKPLYLKYRGDGWPGYFEAGYQDKSVFRMSYNDSWGKVLGKHLGMRCKICPDGIGLLADIAVGDSWNTKDGYPDFEESEGKSFVMVRNDAGQKLFSGAISKSYLTSRTIDVKLIPQIQQYQFQRRKMSAYRILPVYLFSGQLLKFIGIDLIRLMFKTNIIQGVKNSIGVIKRLMRR